MASQVDICNLALINLGQSPNIIAVNPPDGSAYAATAVHLYPIALKRVLSEIDWSFATKIVALTAVDVDKPAAWDYAFAVPTDLERPVMLQESDQEDPNIGIPFEINGDVLYCNSDSVVLRYVYLNTNTEKFSSDFVLALSAYLAHLMAVPVTKDANIAGAWLKNYQSIVSTAKLRQLEKVVNPVAYETNGIAARWA